MMVALHATIHNGSVSLFSYSLSCSIDVHPVWVTPHGCINLSKLDWRARVVEDRLFESRVEVAIIQKDVRIVEPAIEMSFDRFDRLQNSFQLLISSQHDKGGIGAWFPSVDFGVEATGMENFVMLFTDFPAEV